MQTCETSTVDAQCIFRSLPCLPVRSARLPRLCLYPPHLSNVVSGTRREHRAALAIQTAWRGHRARADFLRYRRGVVAAQGLWRSKLARRKLRALRAEAREAGKLMQVRAALDVLSLTLTHCLLVILSLVILSFLKTTNERTQSQACRP